MDADPELNAPVLRNSCIALDEAVLDLDGAAHGVYDAAKLDDRAVAGSLDDAPVMGGDSGVHEIGAETPEARKSSVLVRASQP
jgi:hypothetical protein